MRGADLAGSVVVAAVYGAGIVAGCAVWAGIARAIVAVFQ